MLVQSDKAGLEWRTLLLLSGDQIGIREILEGQDTHALNQAELNLPTRLIAKTFLFRTIFRGSGWAFAKDNDFKHVSTDPKFWDSKNETFFKKYRGIDQCHQGWAIRVMRGKNLMGPSGREWMIEPKLDGSIPWTTLTNYPVQGTGADIVMLDRISLRNRLKTLNLQSKLISTVHDSLIVDAPNKELDKVIELMYNAADDCVKNMKKLWGIDSPIPFPSDVKIGHNLGEMEKHVRN